MSTRDKAAFEAKKLEKRLCRLVGEAIVDYRMIAEGDRVMVCMSGGKDSYGLLDILMKLQRRAPVRFELVAVNLDQRQPGFPSDVLPAYFKTLGIEWHVEVQDTYSIVQEKIPEGKTKCSLCSRLRRGILYRVARELKCNKIALGHHRDDLLQTLLLNLFFAGKIKSMPPKLKTDNGEFIVIRPLVYVKEKDLAAWAAHRAFPIVPCNVCGSQNGLQRQVVGDMLRAWEKQYPGRMDSMSTALRNVISSHLMDERIFDFERMQRVARGGATSGDTAFDDEPLPLPGSTLAGIAINAAAPENPAED